ncbi:MAG: heme biosynthesis HemY N-terminal domain-containing protein [Hyphomicrobium sp.]
MTRLVAFLVAILGLSFGFSWLADNPGTIVVDWQGYHAEPTVFQVVVLTAVLTAVGICLWSIARQIWTSPAAVSHFITKRRQQRGLDALSSGMIAVGAGDRMSATRYALQARKSLPNEPLTHLLRAQAAQLSGDRATSRRIFEAMLSAPDTEQLGLRGLYLEAAREGESEAQRQFAERAIALNPKLSWPVEGLFDLQCKNGDWPGALDTLNVSRRHGTFEKAAIDRRRAVLLTGQAIALEDSQSDKALGLALEAHALAKDLVPAAAIAGRLLAARGNTAKAAKVLQRTWSRSPHPDLATAYAYARIGDSPRDRLDRVKQLAALNPHASEGAIAVANAAIEAHDFEEARDALSPLLEGRLTRRVATLMARLEKEQHGDRGRVREWLARAVHAARDPAWTADGVVAESWAPASPVTGVLDAFQWRVPVEEFDTASSVTGTSSPLDDLMALEAVLDGSPAGETSNIRETPSELSGQAQVLRPASSSESKEGKPVTASRRIEAHEADVVVTAPVSRSAARGASQRQGQENQGDAESGLAVEAQPVGQPIRPEERMAAPTPSAHAAKGQRVAAPASKPVSSGTENSGAAGKAARKSATQMPGSGLQRRQAEPAVIVPLHAPDDPGPEPESDLETDSIRPWPYRLS